MSQQRRRARHQWDKQSRCDKGKAALSLSKGDGGKELPRRVAWPGAREICAGRGRRTGADPRFRRCEIARTFGLNTELHSDEKAKTQPTNSWSQHGGSESLVQVFISSGYGCWGVVKRGRARAISALSIPQPGSVGAALDGAGDHTGLPRAPWRILYIFTPK